MLESVDVEIERGDIPNNIDIALEGFSEYESIMDKKPAKKKKVEVEDPSKSVIYKTKQYKEGNYINCDLRYFNLANIGHFDVVLIDPPWRMLNSQKQGEDALMFSNTMFKLDYQTMSNEEIIDLNVESLAEAGFCFLWVMNSQLQFGLSCLNKWGYHYVDKIVWVKRSKSSNTGIHVSTGYYFLHSAEICLVGVKHSKNARLEYISKVSNDVIFGKIGIQSQKPDELYEIIDLMVPGARKVELFARNHNVRKGWLSLGNRLGPNFEIKKVNIACTKCSALLKCGSPRFKHKWSGQNLCETCVQGESLDHYFRLENNQEEQVFHDWFTCDRCHQYPICGVRYSCTWCQEFDLCEACYDQTFKEQSHDLTHIFVAVEVPDQGGGFAVHHRIRCNGCSTCPIIGERFICNVCTDFNLCHNCFFKQKESKDHEKDHDMEIILDSGNTSSFSCGNCKKVPNIVFQCSTCNAMYLCESCYKKRDQLTYNWYPMHKSFHSFVKIK